MASSKYVMVNGGEPDSNLKCSICLELAEDPQQEVNCGKLFCRLCVRKLGRSQSSCPHCRRTPQYFRDKKSYLEIQEIPVKCSHADKGCTWTGTIATLEDHMTRSCDFAKVACKYESIGCRKRKTRASMTEHVQDIAAHLAIALDTVKKMKETVNAFKIREGITFEMPHFTRKNDKNYYKFEVEFTRLGYRLSVDIFPNRDGRVRSQYLSVAVQIDTNNGRGRPPFKGRVTVTLLNQVADDNHHSCVTECQDGRNAVLHQFMDISKLDYDGERHTEYLKGDKLYFRVMVQEDGEWLKSLHHFVET